MGRSFCLSLRHLIVLFIKPSSINLRLVQSDSLSSPFVSNSGEWVAGGGVRVSDAGRGFWGHVDGGGVCGGGAGDAGDVDYNTCVAHFLWEEAERSCGGRQEING